MSIFHVDPDWWPLEVWPWWLRWFKRAWMYCAPRTTGHGAHALNGLLLWLPISLLVPLSWYWWLPMVFYTMREIPDLLMGHGEWLDHIGDVMWVYAVGFALWASPVALMLWMILVIIVQIAYWSGPAPRWMPRNALLWGR